MQLSELTVEVRDSSLARVGQLTDSDLVGFRAVLRNNNVGSWSVRLPVDSLMAKYLREPGAGIIVSTDQGTLLSGPTTAVVIEQSVDDPAGRCTISGVDDSVLLKERLAYPTPETDDVTAQTSAYDVRTGVAETIMKDYVSANLVSGPEARRVATLSVEASRNLGPTVRASARFESLQELLKGLSDVSGLSFTIEQVGSELQFQVWQPADRSAYIRLDLENGQLSKSEYSYAQPKATRTIVAGQGQAEERTFVERTSIDSLEAETAWGRRIEVFKDQRNTNDLAELEQAGDEILAIDGKTQIAVDVQPTDDTNMRFGVDWNLGDKVGVVVGSTQLTAVVSEVAILIRNDGVRLAATIGEPAALDFETQLVARTTDQALRLSRLERT